jgi:hypothetical protein
MRRLLIGLLVLASATACSSNAPRARDVPAVCGKQGAHPARYDAVVVFAFENRTWDEVGGAGFGSRMPYLHALGRQCAFFPQWNEADEGQDSLAQYVAQVTGTTQPGIVDDCDPSPTCSTTADNIFRQTRVAGLSAVNFVEDAHAPCNETGIAARHVPRLYMRGADDPDHCEAEVRPYEEFDPDRLPNFAFVTPTDCNNGHDCSDSTVDNWAETNIGRVLESSAYRSGRVAVFVWYDENRPVPNLWITPTASSGPHDVVDAGYAGTLAAWESMLGLPCLERACSAPDMRAVANS